MIDHVTIRVPELEEGRRFYALALELVNVGFRAASREQVDAWWAGMTAAGAPDDGPPG